MRTLITRMSVLFVSAVAIILLFPAAAFGVTFPVAVDSTNFPDTTWKEYVNTNFAGGDYVLTQAEAEAVTNINVSGKGIADLTGVEFFTNTQYLFCYSNSLTSLDVTSCTSLVGLYCFSNSLNSLDVTGLTNLAYFDCRDNSLTSLDVTSCTSLKELFCSDNSLTFLDVTSCTRLEDLFCNNNSLTSFDVTGLTNLQQLSCSNNYLLEVVGVSPSSPLIYFAGDSQTRTIPMVSDGTGGFISTSSYPIQTENSLGGLSPGVTYDVITGLFHTDSPIATSSFSTVLSESGSSVTGTLTFSLTYRVTYVANGGSGVMSDPNSPYAGEEIVTILDNTFIAPIGMSFTGWNTASDGSGTSFSSGDTFVITEDTTLYAQWKVNTYTVTFLDWDGTLLGSDTVEYGNAAIAPDDPTRKGYNFIGWDTAFDNVTSDLTVTALYKEVPTPNPSPTPNDGDNALKVAEKSALAKAGDTTYIATAIALLVISMMILVAIRKKISS